MDDTDDIVLEIARDTLRGDIRDFLLDRLKHDKSPLPWDAQPEAVQKATIEAAERAAERLIEEVARIVIAEGKEVVHVALEQVVVKDGIKAVVSCPKTLEAMNHLGAAQGSTVAIVFATTDHVQGQRRPRYAKPDQGELLEKRLDETMPYDPYTGEIIEPNPPPSPEAGDEPPPPPEPPLDERPDPEAGPVDEPEVAEAKKRRGRPPKAK